MTMYDVIVVGGGSAGIGAALAAARSGARTVLVDKNAYLGGTATAGLVTHFDPINIIEATGIAYEIYDNLKAKGGIKEYPLDASTITKENIGVKFWEAGCGFDVETYKTVISNMLERANIELLFHSMVIDVVRESTQIKGIVIYNKNKNITLYAHTIIDCTGDGDVAALAGAAFEVGDESGEIMAPTLCFEVAGVNEKALDEYLDNNPDELGVHPRLGKFIENHRQSSMVQGFYKKVKEAKENDDLKVNILEPGLCMARLPREGVFHINATRVIGVDPLDNKSISHAEISDRKHVEDLFGFMKKYLPGFKDSYILRTACEIGVRESRRIIGEYRLTINDIINGTVFEDAVTRNKWAHSDTHSGKDYKWSFQFIEGPYYIPARCLIPIKIDNLLVAGRCLSADRKAMATIRIQPIATMTGQAAGVMAALASSTHIKVRYVDIKEVRCLLEKAGVNLK